MKARESNGFVGVDMIISIIAVMIFSGLIISLMYTNFLENVKLRRETLATIYLTETLENIGISSYEEITTDNINSFIPEDLEENGYEIQIELDSDLNLAEDENIIKKIKATISYTIQNKNYEHSMERIKVKE